MSLVGVIGLDKCDLEKAIKTRFKVTPVSIEPWISSVIVNANAVSSQNLTYTWRFGETLQSSGPVTSSKNQPFFVGSLKCNTYNDDPIQNSIANAYAIISNFNMSSIATFYNLSGVQMRRFGIGTFNGTNFPAAGTNVNSNQMGNPWDICTPFIQVQTFADATGAVSLQIQFAFNGYRIYIQ